MKQLNLWMSTAILVLCGAATFTSCSSYDGNSETPPSADIEINEANFPDENFRAIVGSRDIDKNQDGMLSAAEIAAVKTFKLDQANINNLKGVNNFTNLTVLYCAANNLGTIDISKLVKLEELGVEENGLNELDITKNVNLKRLWCNRNKLTQLDVSKNIYLTYISCYSNKLQRLDVTKNTQLKFFWCYKNELTQLDVSKNTQLKELWCHKNELTQLDVTKNVQLDTLCCNNNNLTQLDLTKNLKLEAVVCKFNKLTSIRISPNMSKLDMLYCQSNNIGESAMGEIVANLPTAAANLSHGQFMPISGADDNEKNVITQDQIDAAKAKGWKVMSDNGDGKTGKLL